MTKTSNEHAPLCTRHKIKPLISFFPKTETILQHFLLRNGIKKFKHSYCSCAYSVWPDKKSRSVASHQVLAHKPPFGKKRIVNVRPPLAALWFLVKVSTFKLGVGSVASWDTTGQERPPRGWHLGTISEKGAPALWGPLAEKVKWIINSQMTDCASYLQPTHLNAV